MKSAVVFDWDKTLSPHYMQVPLFKEYGVDEKAFWDYSNNRAVRNTLICGSKICCEDEYLSVIQENSKDIPGAMFPGLTNEKLQKLGSGIDTFPGVEPLFDFLNNVVDVDIFIVTSGIKVMLLGHPLVEKYVSKENIHGAEFSDWIWKEGVFEKTPHLSNVIKTITPSDKIRVLMEISKGCKVSQEASDVLPTAIPYENMIYVGDGVSDIYAFEFLRSKGGSAVGVYNPEHHKSFEQLEKIRKDGFLDILGIADFSPKATIGNWIINKVRSFNKNNKDVEDIKNFHDANFSSKYLY
jgi:2-hydroxy-3-keto-5-methylthiopentenyl-1-phosphate phosphatase